MGERTGQEEIFIAVDVFVKERERGGDQQMAAKVKQKPRNLGHFITKNLPFQGAANLTAVTKLS